MRATQYWVRRAAFLLGICVAAFVHASAAEAPGAADKGAAWTGTTRETYYNLDQGSRLIPLAWLRALEQPDGSPFLADHLRRYGFLSDAADHSGIAAGVTLAPSPQGESVGLTCAACHTRELSVRGKRWRVEGAPAFIDFQRLLIDLDLSTQRVLSDDARFRRFADKVVGPQPDGRTTLRKALQVWSLSFHAYASALASDAWGPGRLDAFGLIFNQLAGLDVAKPPASFIPENIVSADAPVRYPFLWNSPFQDKTDWPGFADNGDDRAALARNISEALGVFATFHPRPATGVLNRDYLVDNSEDMATLARLEGMVVALKAPAWPWDLDSNLAAKGKAIFERSKEDGGCVGCHGARRGSYHGARATLATPILDVGTDTRVWRRLGRSVHTGVMAGAVIPGLAALKETDTAANLLVVSVVGILEQSFAEGRIKVSLPAAPAGPARSASTASASLNSYEARVLAGIWAAAPYLHNGSVPTLADLLKKPAQRPLRFAVGSDYDLQNVGLSLHQKAGAFVFHATGCENIGSGNSNCGHDYGTSLKDSEKTALLEYLKSL